MSTLADEDATVVQHHAGEEEGKVSKQMFHFAVSARMRPINHLE
jgi:hypothetical protein